MTSFRIAPIVSFISISFLITACKTELPVNDPFVVGTPGSLAIVGAEYEYNFGSDWGEGIPEFSLSGAPDWLSLELTNNNARKGAIIRGVPGITGGRRGFDDINTTENIVFTVNDGSRSGNRHFEIQVDQNTLSLGEVTVKENRGGYVPGRCDEADDDLTGCTETEAEEKDRIEEETQDESETDTLPSECEVPSTTERGNILDALHVPENGEEQRRLTTYPVLLNIGLRAPSVEPIKVRFELRSSYVDGLRPEENLKHAQLGIDAVASSGTLSNIDYIDYEENGGVITLAPGITSCYIRVEVLDDERAEQEETFSVYLTEVVDGMAGFTGDDVRAIVTVEDDEPSVKFENTTVVQNLGISKRYEVKLDKKVEREIRVAIQKDETSTIRDSEFEFITTNSEIVENALGVVAFEAGSDIGEFYIRVSNSLDEFTDADDKVSGDKKLVLSFVEDYGSNAAQKADQKLTLVINELTQEVLVQQSNLESLPRFVVENDRNLIQLRGYRNESGDLDVGFLTFNKLGVPTTMMNGLTITSPEGADEIPVDIKYVYRSNPGKTGDDDAFLNEVVVAINTSGTITNNTDDFESGDGDIYLASFQRASNQTSYAKKWEMQVGTTRLDESVEIHLDNNGNVYLLGNTKGDFVNERILPENQTLSEEELEKINSGEADYPRGTQLGIVNKGGTDVFVAKILSTGEKDWVRSVGGLKEDIGRGITIVGDGAIFVGGTTDGIVGDQNEGGIDFFTARFNSSGVLHDNSPTQFGTQFDDSITGLAVQGDTVWLSGHGVGDVEKAFVNGDDNNPNQIRDSIDSWLIGSNTVSELRYRKQVGTSENDTSSGVVAVRSEIITSGSTLGAFGDAVNAGQHDAYIRAFELENVDEVDENGVVTSSLQPVINWQSQFGSTGEDSVIQSRIISNDKLYVLWKSLIADEATYRLRVYDARNGNNLSTDIGDALP